MYQQCYNFPPPFNYYTNIQNYSNTNLLLETWLNNRSKNFINIPNTSINTKLQDISGELMEMRRYIKDGQSLEIQLRSQVANMNEEQWNSNINKLKILKDCLEEKFYNFNSSNNLKTVTKCITDRKSKRLYIRHKKNIIKNSNKQQLKLRKVKELKIDNAINGMQQYLEKVKQDQQHQRDSESVLARVKHCISESRHWLSILQATNELRNVRSSSATTIGEKDCPENKENFMKVIAQLKKIWESALINYVDEEQAIKKNISCKDQCHDRELQISEFKVWERILWGHNQNELDQLDMVSFIGVRYAWDQFVVSEHNSLGSKIPIGWIIPSEPSSDEWTQYLNSK